MGEAGIARLKDERLYLVSFEFISGEYGQPFKRTFYAKDERDLQGKIHEYLADYYGSGNTLEIDGSTYVYWHGEVAVKNYGWEEITNFKQLVNGLLY